MTLPLTGVRVVDTTDGSGAMCARVLADLGADVILVEPPGGASSRRVDTMAFAVHNANKRSVELDLSTASGNGAFRTLLAGADVWIDAHRPLALDSLGLDVRALHAEYPQLVIATITDFGLTGPYRDWVATDEVLLALGGQLGQSGIAGRPPVMLPGQLAGETSAIQAAWAILVALWHRYETGVGDVLDISRFEATAQVIDPAFGSVGTGAAQSGVRPTRGRGATALYPTFACADGYVRIVVLAPRQWHAMRAWLGEPPEFSHARFDRFGERVHAADRCGTQSVRRHRHRHRHQRRRGVGRPRPAGYVLVDGERLGIRTSGVRTSATDRDDNGAGIAWLPRRGDGSSTQASSRRTSAAPLAGLRVLDLGVIVMGGEAGRLLADQGADVIKVENGRYPDGARGAGMTPFFVAAQRGKRSLALNLRDAEGVAIFEQLARQADVVLSNFKPGTLESLGIGPDWLREINPRLVVVTSSAMGESGPWRDWMGYGPLVRCVSGLTSLWRDDHDSTADAFGDITTIYPDHFVARIVDAVVLASLIHRRRTGMGAHVESSQAEAIIVSLGPEFVRESLGAGTAPRAAAAPWGVFPCAGDDQWCAITVRDDDEWARLVEVIGSPSWAVESHYASIDGRVRARDVIHAKLAVWTSTRSSRGVATTLQSAGVPAGAMAHIDDLRDDPQLVSRRFFATMTQPGLDADVFVERGHIASENLAPPALRAAPYYGEHTREVCRTLLGLDDAATDALMARGVLDDVSRDDASRLGRH